jgi:uncharacterized membrane protein
MLQRLLTLWRDLRSSLWALPLGMVAAAAAIAIMAVNIRVDPGNDPAWFLYSGNAKDAPELLSNLVTAMITMATLVVSITMVVLALAAQQLGPRLIRSFMADRRTQATLGLFVATVVYLLLVLRSTYGAQDEVPNLAVSGGTALVLVCLIALLIFVHHLATSIIADNTIDRVGDALDADVARLLPGPDFKPCPPPSLSPREHRASIRLSRGGYVQAIDHRRLAEVAAKADAVIELAVKAGDHTIEGETWAFIAPPEAASAEFQGKVEDSILLGSEQASIQDLETSIRQLVEVALRALSPSLNDPYTAIAVIDRLTESLGKIMRRGCPQQVWADEGGTARLVAPSASFADLTATAFNQIRQHSTGSPPVLIHLAKALGKLVAQADASQRAVLAENIRMVMETGRRDLSLEQDLTALEHCVKAALDRGGS